MYKSHLPFRVESHSSCCDYVASSLNMHALVTATWLQSLAPMLFSCRNLAHYVTSQSLMLLICKRREAGSHNTCTCLLDNYMS